MKKTAVLLISMLVLTGVLYLAGQGLSRNESSLLRQEDVGAGQAQEKLLSRCLRGQMKNSGGNRKTVTLSESCRRRSRRCTWRFWGRLQISGRM